MDQSSSQTPGPMISPPIMLFGKRIRSGELISPVGEIKEELSPRGVVEGAGVSCGVSSDEEQDRITDKTKLSNSANNGSSTDLINCSETEINFAIKQTINSSNGGSRAGVSLDNQDDDDVQSPSFRTSKAMKIEFSNCETKSEISDQSMADGEKQSPSASARSGDNSTNSNTESLIRGDGGKIESPKEKIRRHSEQLTSKEGSTGAVQCPRCNSTETKFCYFNNYNVNQPRHFCKRCQRYWTAGGTLRNVPIGSGKRKSKQALRATAAFAGASNLSDAGGCRTSNPEPSSDGLITPSAPLNFPIDGLITHPVSLNHASDGLITPPVSLNYSADGLITAPVSLNYPIDGIINAMNAARVGLIEPRSQGSLIRSLSATINPSSYVANLETSLNHHKMGLQGPFNGFIPTKESNEQSQGTFNMYRSSDPQSQGVMNVCMSSEPPSQGSSQESLNSMPKNPSPSFTPDKVSGITFNNLSNLVFNHSPASVGQNTPNTNLGIIHHPSPMNATKLGIVLGSNDGAPLSNPSIQQPLASQTCTSLAIPSVVITTTPNLIDVSPKKSPIDDTLTRNQYGQSLPMLGGVWPCFYNMFWASSLSPQQAMMAWSQFAPMVNMNQPWSLASLEAFTKITNNNPSATTTSQLIMDTSCMGIPTLNDESVVMNNLGDQVVIKHTTP